MAADAPPTNAPTDRAERKRNLRKREFLEAARHVMAEEGFEGLSMSRVARELDTVVSAIYRYFPSKGAFVAEIQKEALDQLSESLETVVARSEERFAAAGVTGDDLLLARLVLIGRWFCAANDTHLVEVRLLQTLLFRRDDTLDDDDGRAVLPHALRLLTHAVAAIEAAQAAGAIGPGDSFERAIIWTAAMSGALQSDGLEKYLPDVFGGGRLARQASLDVLAGFEADRDRLGRATALVDELEHLGPLAP